MTDKPLSPIQLKSEDELLSPKALDKLNLESRRRTDGRQHTLGNSRYREVFMTNNHTRNRSIISTTVSLDKKGKPSVTHTRFLQQRENLQQTLVRKLLARYIDANPEFSIVDKRIWHELQQPTDLPVEPIK